MWSEGTTRTKRTPPPHSDVDCGTARFDLIGWLGFYQWLTPGVRGAVRENVVCDDGTVRPDVLLRVSGLPDETEGLPELTVDVFYTSADEDLGPKRDLYRKFGVQEYIVYRVAERALDWFVLRKGYYWPLAPGPDGIIRSEVFPGLWLDPAVLIAGDAARVLTVAQLGHGSPEHTAFLQELARRAANPV